MKPTRIYYELRDALQQDGCPVCRVVYEAGDRFVDGLLYEKVNDPGLRERIRAAQGFCSAHAWMLDRHGASLGVAIISRDVLRHLLTEVGAHHAEKAGLQRISNTLRHQDTTDRQALIAALSPQGKCPVCTVEQEIESTTCDVLLNHLSGDELLSLYRDSDGLCLPHFRHAVTRASSGVDLEKLVTAQKRIWNRLEKQLSELIRKSDYRFRHEAMGSEDASWLRAIAALSGEDRNF